MGRLKINLRRWNAVDDFVQAAKMQTRPHERVVIEFVGEAGSDAGGLTRDFLTIATDPLFDKAFGTTEDGTQRWFHPNDECAKNQEIVDFAFAAGFLVRIAVDSTEPISSRFADPIFEKLSGSAMSLAHLGQISPTVLSGLNSIRKNFDEGIDPCVFFEDGRPVTAESFDAFQDEYVKKAMETDVSVAFEAFQRGFLLGDRERPPRDDEVRSICSAPTVVDWDELRRTQNLTEYRPDDVPVKLFWSIFEAFEEEDKKKLLGFITGSRECPIGGFSRGHITLERRPWDPKRPSLAKAHTCSRRLELPDITDRDGMLRLLRICIDWGAEFHMG
jgi:hypothetical protein